MLSQSTEHANVIDVSNPDKFYKERDRINNDKFEIPADICLQTFNLTFRPLQRRPRSARPHKKCTSMTSAVLKIDLNRC